MFHKLATLLLLFPLTTAAQTAVAEQEWDGTMKIGSTDVTLRIRAWQDGTKAKATLRRLNPDGPEFELDTFEITGDALRLSISKGLKAEFTGFINSAGTSAVGLWKQNGTDVALTLKRVERQQLLEVWRGTLAGGPEPLELQFRIFENESGKQFAKFDSLTEKTTGLTARAIRKHNKILFAVESLKALFEGEIDESGDKTTGLWTQGGTQVEMTFAKVTEEAEVPAAPMRPVRRQTPTGPFRYEIEEVTFSNKADKVDLAGILTRPIGDTATAAVVLISGSGPQDRDGTIFDHKPFWVIADELTKAGIAVLRFDDRGFGSSTGDFSAATSADFANDVRAAVAFLQKHKSIDPKQIGLIGHSEGGLIAPMVAANNEDIAFMVLMAGPGVNGFEILRDQGRRIALAEGIPPEQVEAESAIREAIAQAVREAPASAEGGQTVEQAIGRFVAGYPAEQQAQVRPSPEQVEVFKQLGSPWFRLFLQYEPSTSLRNVKCPVLAINGERDLQVWHETNLQAIASALKSGGNTRFRAVRLPALNHLFQRAQTGAVSEYSELEQTMAPEVLHLLRTWIKAQAKR